jgi:CheY-like chemotaxis protein
MLLGGKRIFIVEDNSLNRVVYNMTLRLEGAWLEFDRWGFEAAAKLRTNEKWDLIILDLMLSRNISGFDIFEQIREMPQHNATPIVAISASEPETAIARARKLGFAGFIAKPVDEALLVRQIASLIAGEQVWYDGTTVNG